MDYKHFRSTWDGLQSSNRFLKFLVLFLLTLNVLMAVGWLKKDAAIILVPPSLSENSEIAKNKASEGYKKAWALYAASLIGNVTPENADFVLKTFQGMITSDLRAAVTNRIMSEVNTLRVESVTSSFEIDGIGYEAKSDKVFVFGKNKLVGPTQETKISDETIEFIIEVKQFHPFITHLASYKGPPRTIKMLEMQEKSKN